jgi:hypothetical protein
MQIDLFEKPTQATVTNSTISPKQVTLVERYIEHKLGRQIHLMVNLLPITRIEEE